ncbi:MAG: four helix bundle protein, partial [Burkholderiales bacterium]
RNGHIFCPALEGSIPSTSPEHHTTHKHQVPSTKLQTSTKLQAPNSKHQIPNTERGVKREPIYDLEERTLVFAKAVRTFAKTLPRTIANVEDAKQLIRSSGSVGANYREANAALSKKDFSMRIRISRKEAKECCYWLRLIRETNTLPNAGEADRLLREADELRKILSSIAAKAA